MISNPTKESPRCKRGLVGNNSDEFSIMQRTISNVTPAIRTVTNTAINVQLSTEQPRIGVGGVNMNVLSNLRFNLIAAQISSGTFPRGNVIQMPNLFNIAGLAPTGNRATFNAVLQQSRAIGFIGTNIIQTRQRTYGE